ncbi:MAG: hypothetical protein Q4D38_11690 [Planctomycetia bacterium]|nr:hypothetical protein [Planctomycetia bacterium]
MVSAERGDCATKYERYKVSKRDCPAILGGSWSHATTFTELVIINGKKYLRWDNSHDLIYHDSMFGPAFGALMSVDTAKRFLGGRWTDLAVVTYVESPYDEQAATNLNPVKAA